MFSMVNRSPLLWRAFPPTATTNRFFFLAGIGVDGVVAAVALAAVEKNARRANPALSIAWLCNILTAFFL